MTNRHPETLSDYRRLVRIRMMKSDGTPINNSTEEHAKIIIENLARRAKREINILSGSLTRSVYGCEAVVKAVDNFLTRSTQNNLKLILEEYDSDILNTHPLIKVYLSKPNFTLKIAPEDLKLRYEFHAFVSDDDSYRFESDRARPVGIAAFGHKEGAKHLNSIFHQLWKKCVDPPRS